jgi:copper resistance protein C
VLIANAGCCCHGPSYAATGGIGSLPVGHASDSTVRGVALVVGEVIGSRGRRILVAASLAVTAVCGAALPALAHANLLSSSPVARSQVSANPPYVDLRFSSRVIGAEQVEVHDASGHGVAIGPPEVLEAGLRMRARLPTLGSGDYIVDWRALSADGHLSLGRYGFSIGVAGRQVGSSNGPVPAL